MRIEVVVATDKVGSRCSREIDLDDNDYRKSDGSVDTDAVEEVARDVMFEMIEWSWKVQR